MDRLLERLTIAGQATATLREVALLPAPTRTERDAAIQRFEYSVEAVWKAARRFPRVVEGVEVGSPKAAVRASREAGLLGLDATEEALRMVDDRNLTAHTYNEALAVAIFGRLPRHLATLEGWLTAMAGRLPVPPA
jgi:nucleotidyltransferase substrate binding protein (TIGR01987 family)